MEIQVKLKFLCFCVSVYTSIMEVYDIHQDLLKYSNILRSAKKLLLLWVSLKVAMFSLKISILNIVQKLKHVFKPCIMSEVEAYIKYHTTSYSSDVMHFNAFRSIFLFSCSNQGVNEIKIAESSFLNILAIIRYYITSNI
jgi:hypothetical protein